MRDLFVLLKANIFQTFGIGKLRRKGEDARSGVMWGLIVFFALLILAGITAYMAAFLAMMKETKVPLTTIFPLAVTIVTFFSFVSSLLKASPYLFRTKDYDMLMALPIRTSTIVATKLLSLYLFELLFSLAIMLCTNIAYFFFAPFSILVVLISLALSFLIPLLPVVIASFFSFLFGFIPLPDRTKNMIGTIIYLVFFTGLVIMNMTTSTKTVSIMVDITQYNFLATWSYAWYAGSGLAALYILAVSLLPAIVFVIIVGRSFLAVNSLMSKTRGRKNYRLSSQRYHNSGEVRTIFKKELRQLFSGRMILLNIIMGPIMTMVMPVVVLIDAAKISEAMTTHLGFPPGPESLVLVVCVFTLLFTLITPHSAAAISLEGKSFWLLKSSPVSAKSVILGKSLPSILIFEVSSLVQSVIVTVITGAQWYMIPVCFACSSAFIVGFVFFGLFLNLLFPKFDYDNPVKAIKQGKPALLCMLTGFFFSMVLAAGAFFILPHLGVLLTALCVFGFGLLLSTIFTLLLFIKGPKIYEDLAG